MIITSSRPNPERRQKIKLNVYFHTSLQSLKRFYEGLNPFVAPQRSVKIKIKLNFIAIQLSEMHGTERVNNDHIEYLHNDVTTSNDQTFN